MPVKSSPSAGEWANPVEVTCSNCITKSYVHAGKVRDSGGWECHTCGKQHQPAFAVYWRRTDTTANQTSTLETGNNMTNIKGDGPWAGHQSPCAIWASVGAPPLTR
jgi:hypothetical protein